MARFYITGITGGMSGVFSVSGHVLDQAADVNTELSAYCDPIDPNLATSARQQIQEQLVRVINAQLVTSGIPLTLIASDIEWVC